MKQEFEQIPFINSEIFKANVGSGCPKAQKWEGVICGPYEALEISPAVFDLIEITCI